MPVVLSLSNSQKNEDSLVWKIVTSIISVSAFSQLLLLLWYWIIRIMLSDPEVRIVCVMNMDKMFFPTISFVFIVTFFVLCALNEDKKRKRTIIGNILLSLPFCLLAAGILYIPVSRVVAITSMTERFREIIDSVIDVKLTEQTDGKLHLNEPFLPIEVLGDIVTYSQEFKKSKFKTAQNADEVRSIVIIRKSGKETRTYLPSGTDMQWVFKVTVFDWPSKKIIDEKSFLGLQPTDRSGTIGGGTIYGWEPWHEVFDYIAHLKKQ